MAFRHSKRNPVSSRWLYLPLLLVLLLSTLLPGVAAQSVRERPPLDIMVIIDNSCSMFPEDLRLPQCDVWGNDPDFLRLVGSNLFFARLGFGDANAEEYQVGVISMGDNPAGVVKQLSTLNTERDALARAVDGPDPLLATHIVSALEDAYAQLTSTPPHKPGNQPAIVLFTDGEPYPREGQSDAVIESLIAQHPDIPLFVMLLQDPAQRDERLERYVQFWDRMQSTYAHVRSYPVSGTEDIVRKYNEIVAILQNTISVPPEPLGPGQSLYIDIGQCVNRLEITVIQERGQNRATVVITDSSGTPVQRTDPGVQWSDNVFNPTDVIIINQERLDAAPRDGQWSITSDANVQVITDRAGCYGISFVEPPVSLTTVNNQYLGLSRVSPSLPIDFQIKLVDQLGQPFMEPQPLVGMVYPPRGVPADLPIPAGLVPSTDGVYRFSYDLGAAFPAARDGTERYRFRFQVGRANDVAETLIPIAQADLLLDVGRGPYIMEFQPDSLVCGAGQPTDITVTVGDLDSAEPGSIQVRALGSGSEVLLSGSDATFTGSLDPLCMAVLAGLACDTTVNTEFRLRLTGRLADGSTAPAVERIIPVRADGAVCPTATPLPTPTPTPTPIPPPPPLPDTDGDGCNDLVDPCPDQAGWSFLGIAGDRCCPPPIWLLVLVGLALVGILAFVILWLIPTIRIRISPPPKAYIMICRKGEKMGVSRSVFSAGMDARKSRVTIGGDKKKDQIYVKDLQPGEFTVVQENDKVVLQGKDGATKATFGPNQGEVNTSVADITLKHSLDPKLRC